MGGKEKFMTFLRSRLKKGSIVEIELLGGHKHQGKVVKVGLTKVILCPQKRVKEKGIPYVPGKRVFTPEPFPDISVDTKQTIHIKKKFIVSWSYLSLSDILDTITVDSEKALDSISNLINHYDSDGFCK